MIILEYANAYREVLEILKYVPIQDFNKIPKEKIEMFKMGANADYYFTYNPNKTLNEQNVSKIAKGIIAILFRDYWATEIQRNKIITKQNYDRLRVEEEKKEKYNVDNMFKNNDNIQTKIENTKTIPIVLEEKSIMKMIIEKIKKFFRRIESIK